MDKETILSIFAKQDFYLETLDKLAEVVIEGMDFLDLPEGNSLYDLKEDVFVALDKVFETYLD